MKPSFICVGASKSGTTTLHDVLKIHKSIFLPEKKETKFFVSEEDFNKGIKYYESEYFKITGKAKIAGEVCPQYMSSKKTAERIYRELGGETKLIFMLRNPIERAYSHYLMKTRSWETLSFSEAINDAIRLYMTKNYSKRRVLESHLDFNEYKNIFKDKININAFRFSRYLFSGMYSSNIKEYLKYFPKENIKLVFFEDLLENFQETINDILLFLNVEGMDVEKLPQSNSRKIFKNGFSKRIRNATLIINSDVKKRIANFFGHKNYTRLKSLAEKSLVEKEKIPQMNLETKDKLINFYKGEIEELEYLSKRNLNHWLK